MRTGTFKSKYNTGEPFSDVEYKDGVRHGKMIKYHKNGNILMTCNFINDKRDGLCVTYNEDGSIHTKEMYERGTYMGTVVAK